MKRKLYLLGMFAATAFLTACSQDDEKESKLKTYEVTKEANYEGDEFVTVAEGDKMELLLQPSTGIIRWMNKETGEYMDSKQSAGGDYSSETALSDIVVSYYSGGDDTKYNKTSLMDTYTYGILTDTLTYEEMENGVRFVYQLGSTEITYKNFPAYISDERLNELVIQYLDSAEDQTKAASLKKQLTEKHYRKLSDGRWVRSYSEDSPLRNLAADQLYETFYVYGHYTEDDLLTDNTEWDKLDDMPSAQSIQLVVEYTLDGDDFIVNIPTEYLLPNEDYPVQYVQVLPTFMMTSEDDGYLFVPDGSGSLIYLDSQKDKESLFSARYYGGDILQNMETYVSANPQMMLPVYGMKAGDVAVLGVIEEGAQVAKLDTYIKNSMPSIPDARETLTFYINDAQQLFQYMGSVTKYTMVKCPTDYYCEDIRVRYSYLTGDDADYIGMAQKYQDLLVENGTLTKKETASADAPLFLTLLGELDKEKYFLGIPYDSSIALTSFDDAAKILKDLAASSVSNLIVKYDGIVNGGLNQRAVEKVKLSSRLGGSSDWKDLLAAAEEVGAQIFPSVNLNTAYTKKSLSKSEIAYTLLGQQAIIYTFDAVEHVAEKEEDYLKYVIAPKYIEKYVERFAKSYDKLGVNNVASDDFMTFISADYRNDDHVSQTTALPMYQNALNTLSEKYNVMLSNPIVEAYSSVDYLIDIPLGNSEMKILDASVPFIQTVLDGYITFGSDYVNKSSESIQTSLMRAIEAKSPLNFRLIDTATSNLTDTTKDDVFFSEYDSWKDDIVESYDAYNAFYQKVKDAEIVDHQIGVFNNSKTNNDLRIVTYSNGVKAYFNYSDEDMRVDGVEILAQSYVIVE